MHSSNMSFRSNIQLILDEVHAVDSILGLTLFMGMNSMLIFNENDLISSGC